VPHTGADLSAFKRTAAARYEYSGQLRQRERRTKRDLPFGLQPAAVSVSNQLRDPRDPWPGQQQPGDAHFARDGEGYPGGPGHPSPLREVSHLSVGENCSVGEVVDVGEAQQLLDNRFKQPHLWQAGGGRAGTGTDFASRGLAEQCEQSDSRCANSVQLVSDLRHGGRSGQDAGDAAGFESVNDNWRHSHRQQQTSAASCVPQPSHSAAADAGSAGSSSARAEQEELVQNLKQLGRTGSGTERDHSAECAFSAGVVAGNSCGEKSLAPGHLALANGKSS
jgi:hypothetical protein